MNVHNYEIIGKLVVEKAEAEEQLEIYRAAIDRIRQELVCISGPLNDNREGFTPEQLRVFFRIQGYCNW